MPQGDSIPKDSWVIGRAEDCDLVVPEPTVGSHHCRLSYRNGGFTVEDLNSRNGTFVNGSKIASGEQVPVAQGTRVILGGKAEMPWPSVPPAYDHTILESQLFSQTGSRARLAAAEQRPITIGRDPASTVPVDLPSVSWNHAVINFENGKYILEDRGSLNGTAIGQLNNRIQRAVLDPQDEVFLGTYKIAASRLLSREKRVELGEAALKKVAFPQEKNAIEIGRDPQADVTLEFPTVSWRHVRLARAGDGIVVEDLGSRNGTFVDGIRISGKVRIKTGQEIGLGSFRFQLLEHGELVQRKYYGNVTIEAKDVVVTTPNGKRRLLSPLSLTVFPSELVALMGPAGAGKTTLLRALNGYTRPAQGTVLFNGADLYRFYDRFRQQMGYVPQDDIMHPQLTVREALYFSARLRTDLSESEIETRTKKILEDLEMAKKIDDRIGSPERKTLSGGQRKRVNIALELITDTPALFLDEPTSGLSSYDAESVVDLLKGLAKSGKTIITTIHQPSLKVYKQFDDLIMICRDKNSDDPAAMVFFGPAFPDAIQFFNPTNAGATASFPVRELNPEMLEPGMNAVPESSRTEVWRQRYCESRYQKEFVAERSGKQPGEGGVTGEEKPRRQFGLGQWFALVKRNVIVKLRDRAQMAILLLQAPFLAVLVCVVVYPLDSNDWPGLVEKLLIAHFLMVVAATWFGCNNAARDIVGEWTVYRRERMVTLKLLPYVFSKLAVLLVLCAFQCGTMLGIVYLVCGLHSGFLADFGVLLATAMIGAGLGLFVSAVSRTTESAIALLPVILLPIIALAGGLRPVYQLPAAGRVASAIIPSRWAVEANLLQEAKAKEWPSAPQLAQAAVTPASAQGSQPQTASALPVDCTLDLAGHSFPICVVEASTGIGGRLRAVSASDPLHTEAPDSVQRIRHRYRDSLAILGLMLFLSVVAVIDRLRRRDRDPQ
jgi:ABC-type multidrug transport system ATPase subunit